MTAESFPVTDKFSI